MRKAFVALMMLASCSFISAQIDSTVVEQSAKMIGGNEQKTPVQTQQPPVQTQTMQKYRKAQWFTIGAKLGYNATLAHDKINHEYQYSLHTGLRHGGSIGLYLRLGTNFYCQPEVLYSFAIYNESRVIANDSLFRDLQNHTIDVPVLFGYSPVCSETFKFRIMIGPRFAFNVNTNKDFNVIQPTQALTASVSKARLGLDCGIGFDVWRITIDLRYILMQDIFKYQYQDHETNEYKRVNFLTSTFNVSIGYNIWGNNMPDPKKQKYNPDAYNFFRRDRR